MHQQNILLPSPPGRGKAAVGGVGEGLLVKVCGMRSPDNIRAVAQLSVDMMGFIFYPQSSRYVGMTTSHTGLLPDHADEALGEAMSGGERPLGEAIGGGERHIYKVGVFVDATVQDIITRIVGFRLDGVQLHGSESPTFISNLRSTVVPDICPRLTIMKAVSIGSAADFDQCRQYEGVADMFVFDTRCTGHGGSGEQFDWSLLQCYHGSTPFLLSGGICEADARRISEIHHPQFAGVDLNSRFETVPAVKDADSISRFIEQLRRTE